MEWLGGDVNGRTPGILGMGRIDQAVALREGRIAAAALDVFDGEPEVNPALLDCDHLVLSPHIVSATTGARRRMAAMAVDKLLVFFGHGEHVGRPPNLLDLQAPERRG